MSRLSLVVSVLLVIAAPLVYSGEKKPVPPPEALKAADQQLEKDLKEAFAGPEKGRLEALLKYAQDHADKPALQFAALNMCLQRGISFGSSEYAGRAGWAMANGFEGIKFDIFMGLMLEVEKGAPQKISYAALWDLYDTLARLARVCDDLQTAKMALDKLTGLIGKDKAYRAKEVGVPGRKQSLEAMLAESDHIAAFRERLKKNPNDKEANNRIGQYYLIIAENTSMAYPFFEKTKETKWLALCDFSSRPNASNMTSRVEKADALWQLADETPHYALKMKQLAQRLYQSSFPQGGRPPEPGYPMEHVEKRLQEARQLGLDSNATKPKDVQRRGGAPDGGISDLTEKALPTREELQAIAQGVQKAGKSSTEFSKYVLGPTGELLRRLGSDGATWNDSDYQARMKAAIGLVGPVVRQMKTVTSAPSFTPTLSTFRDFVARAPSVAVFANRLKSYDIYLRQNTFQGSSFYIPPRFDGEIREFIKEHLDQYPDLKSRLALCDQLRAAGFTGEWMDRLKNDLVAEHGGK